MNNSERIGREVSRISTDKEKIAFVCGRYGPEVNGGAEAYCRQLAEKLTAYYDVTVYTTCAVDYKSWKNEYAPGEAELAGVHVRRYPNERIRKRIPFALFSRYVMHVPFHSAGAEEKWIDAQGPFSPALIKALERERGEYAAVLFMTYLYYPTVRGIRVCPEKAVLIPTVHDERPVYLRCYDRVFESPKAIAWNTPEEKAFAEKRFPRIRSIPGEMTGIGVDLPAGDLPEIPEELRGEKYLLYAGRIDRSKGCGEMFEYFLRFRREQPEKVKLVLIGKPVMEIPRHPDIIPLGFVSEEMKFALMGQAAALTLFSPFESLSMVVLESMAMGRPVLVTGKSEVLKGHCVRSGAGISFATYEEFASGLRRILEGGEESRSEAGKRYVRENYCWEQILNAYRRLIGISGGESHFSGEENSSEIE